MSRLTRSPTKNPRKEGSTLMAKGKMGERVSEDAQLKLTDLVVDCGYKARKSWEVLVERLVGILKS